MQNPYDVLGVSKTASAKDIKSAFRKLAKKHHPDQNPDDPKAKDRFSQVNQAYEIVGDEKNRAAFDRGEIGPDGKPLFHGFEGAAGDPFAGFRRQGPGGGRYELFGQQAGARGFGARRAQPGADVNVSLDVTIEEAATAAKVTANFPNGKTISVKLPAYLEDGQTIRLKGQGEPGLGGAGDALVKIRFRRDPRYRVEGRDLHSDVEVPLADAVLGAKVAVETPTGKVAVTVPAWSSSDKLLRLKGRGLPEKAGGHGDFYAHIRVMLPDHPDAELEGWAKAKKG
jgi:DnaJ-class molecular chaperone